MSILNNNVCIVGCGTTGSNLAIELIKNKLTDYLTLIDYDVVSGQVYPFEQDEIGLHKVFVTRNRCLIENPQANITCSIGKVDQSTNLNGYFVIDCRDKKTKDIPTDVRISLDGQYLTIDSKLNYIVSSQSKYVFLREEKYICEAMSILMKYFEEERYLQQQCESYVLTGKVNKQECYVD